MSTTGYIYIRFSTAEQAKGHSEARQLEECRRYCRDKKVALSPEVYADRGLSGYKGQHLEKGGALRRFIADVDAGTIPKGSLLLVENLDRLSRLAPEDAFMLLHRITQSGIVVVTTDDEKEYKRGGDTLSLVNRLLQFDRSHGESERKSGTLTKVFASKREKARAKVPMGDVGPTWLRLSDDKTHYTVIKERADVVERIFQMTIAGHGKNAIAKTLNAEGVPGPRSDWPKPKPFWSVSTVHHLVKNRAVLGEYQPKTKRGVPTGEKRLDVGAVIADHYPRIISDQTFKLAQTAIATRYKEQSTRQTANFNVWQNVAKCLYCASAMHIANKNSRTTTHLVYLECSLGKRGMCKSHRLIRLDRSEQVFRLMLARLDSLDLVKGESVKIAKALKENSASLDDALRRQAELVQVLAQVRSVSVGKLVESVDEEVAALKMEGDRLEHALAAEEAIDFDTFMARLDLLTWEGRKDANDLLKRLKVLVYVSPDRFVVTQPGWIHVGRGKPDVLHRVPLLGLAYFDGETKWAEVNPKKQFHPRPDEEHHETAARALAGMPRSRFHSVKPMKAGARAFHLEDEADAARQASRESEGHPVEDGWLPEADGLELEPDDEASVEPKRRPRRAKANA